MNSIKLNIFLYPAIAVMLCVLLFSYVLKKSNQKSDFKNYILIVFVVAVILNIVWELAQLYLYNNAVYNIAHISFCALASIADAIMITLMYLLFAAVLKNALWIRSVKWYQILILVVVGATGAILSEKRHLNIGTWDYSYWMPIIPIVKVGLSPVLQFMLLPTLSYILSLKYLQKQLKTIKNFNH